VIGSLREATPSLVRVDAGRLTQSMICRQRDQSQSSYSWGRWRRRGVVLQGLGGKSASIVRKLHPLQGEQACSLRLACTYKSAQAHPGSTSWPFAHFLCTGRYAQAKRMVVELGTIHLLRPVMTTLVTRVNDWLQDCKRPGCTFKKHWSIMTVFKAAKMPLSCCLLACFNPTLPRSQSAYSPV